MPNLAGLYLLRENVADVRGVLARMAQVLDVPSVGCVSRTAVGPRAGCVNLLRETAAPLTQPAHDRANRRWLMLDGEIYNVEELRRGLRRAGSHADGLDDAQLCLALYALEGERFVSRLNGQFNLVVYHSDDDSLLIANDRYGYRPLFVAESGGRFFFAVEMKAIIAALDQTPAVDGIGLLQIMRDGIAVGERTWLEPIRVLDPATLLRVTKDGRVQRRRYFQYRHREGGTTMSLPAFVEGFGIHLHRATERIMKGPGRIGISLSGGLDSRSVVLSIHPSHLPIPAYTFGYPESRDVVYAKQLAALLHLEHTHLTFDPGYLGRVMAPVVWRNEALFPFAASTSIYFHDHIGARMDTILNGHCGDAVSGSHLRPYMLWQRSRAKLIARLYAGRQLVADESLRRVFNPDFYRRHSAELFDAFRATFTAIDSDEIANVADAWDMENRQRRGTFHSPSVDRYRFEQRTPFLDNDLVDHLLTAPPRWRFEQQAYKKMIVYAFPQAHHVPWAYTGRPVSPSPAFELARAGWNFGRNRVGGLVAKLRADGRLVGQAFRDLATEIRDDQVVIRSIVDFTDAPWFPADVFDARGITQIVDTHRQRQQDQTHLLNCLATFAAACRMFLYERLGTNPLATMVPAQAPLAHRGMRDTGSPDVRT